jgi:HPt (histidine-containing phosphotransfer) domain-containing protein
VQVLDTTSVLNRDQLRDIAMNDADLMRELFSALIDDTSQHIQLLGQAIQDRDRNRCMRLAHSSKGACANVGANRAAQLFREIERDAVSGAFEKCTGYLGTLRQELDLLKQESI